MYGQAVTEVAQAGGGFAWPRRSSTKLWKGTSVQVVKSHAGSFCILLKSDARKYVVLF